MPSAKKSEPSVNGKKWWASSKWITLLLFIYNTILGYVIIKISGSAGLPLLLIIAVDYIIIFLFATHVSGIIEKRRVDTSRRPRRA